MHLYVICLIFMCSVLPRVAVSCSVLQRVAVCYGVLQCINSFLALLRACVCMTLYIYFFFPAYVRFCGRMYTYICIYTYMVYARPQIRNMCKCLSTHVYIYVCVVYVYVCVCVCARVCMYAYIHEYIYI